MVPTRRFEGFVASCLRGLLVVGVETDILFADDFAVRRRTFVDCVLRVQQFDFGEK